jgi:hypothetical protein
MQTDKPLFLPRPILAAVVMLLSAGAFAALIAWLPVSIGASRDTLPVSSAGRAGPDAAIDARTLPLEAKAPRKARCGECGRIESIRKIEDHGGATPKAGARGVPARSVNHEITVRLQDGSSRVMIDTNPGRWRLGERVKLIDGFAGPGA